MKLVKIKDLGTIVSGATPKSTVQEYWNGNIPWVTPKEVSALDTPFLNATERKLTKAGYESCSTKLVPKGTILFTSRAPIGQLAIANIEVCTNQGFKSLVLKNEFLPLYIYYTLKYYSKNLNFLGTGSTFKELSTSTFEEFEIPVPALSDQIKIAKLIRKSEILISQRKDTIELLNSLIKSVFRKMFGNPATKSKSFSQTTIGELIQDAKYGTSKPSESNGKYVYLRMNNITDQGYWDFSNLKYINLENHEKEKYIIKKGDLIFNRTNSKELVGKSAVYTGTQKMAIAGYLIRARINEKANPWYVWAYLNSSAGKQNLNTLSRHIVGMANINLQELEAIKINRPPINLQNKFGEIAQKVVSARDTFIQHCEDLDRLYQSITQRIFSGTLNIDKVNTALISIATKELYRTSTSEIIKILPEFKDSLIGKMKVKSTQKRPKNRKLKWDEVSIEQISNWVKNKYLGHHFSFEMMKRYLEQNHIQGSPDYFSSEDLKKDLSLHSQNDFKKFIFSAVITLKDQGKRNDSNPFLQLEQIFYNRVTNEPQLNLVKEDKDLIAFQTEKQISGIYFKIHNEAIIS
jgi:type I restriction enzyme S subunit